MKTLSAAAVLLTVLPLSVIAADPAVPTATPTPLPAEKTEEKAAPKQEDLEKIFTETLTNATFTGRWSLVKNGALTPERDEKYGIQSVVKGADGKWTINAQMKYGQQDLTLPVPVKVEWAGDTAVIIVDKLGIPFGNTYSARVLVYEDTYAGTWSGGGHAGLLSGLITREEKKKGAE